MKLADAPKELERALRRLDPEQKIVGRRNARRAVLAVLSATRRALDEEYPRIKSAPTAKPKTAEGKLNRWKARGYDFYTDNYSTPFAEARIPIVRAKGYTSPLAPAWAVEAMRSTADVGRYSDRVKLLRKLRLDRTARKLFMVERALVKSDDDGSP